MLVSSPLFFTTWDPPNRYHKLFRLQNGFVLGSKTNSQTGSHFGTDFFSSFCRFCDFLHTTSSASRIAPAISKPHFRLSSFLLFLLSLRPCFRRLFGPKWVPKRNPKRNPKPDLSKRDIPPAKNPVFQKGVRNGTPKGGSLLGSCLFYVGLLFFARFWGLPTLLWTIICPHFRALGLDFLVFSRLRFQDFGANETHPIHTHKPTIFIFHKGCPLRAGGDARSVRN